jgi:hypothetical protein
MPRKSFYIFLIFFYILTITNLAGDKSLKLSKDKHFFVYEDGTPFFYLGDTAWELFHCLNRDEADKYLSDRAEKGFTVIQAVILSDIDGLSKPNAYGDLPLIEKDPQQPNEAYFKHVDYIVNNADSLGLFIGMLPTWGGYWSSSNPERTIFTPENARVFGKFLGKRYIDKSIIWILGGDRNIKNEYERKIIDAMTYGLREGDEGNHLITFHPRGPGFSSDYLHQADWAGF